MKRTTLILFLLILFYSSCTFVEKSIYTSLLKLYPCERHHFKFKDGFKATYYTFELGNADSIDTYIFAIHGSDHSSVQIMHFLFRDYPGNAKVFALQKRNLPHNSTPFSEPPQEYHNFNYFSQWTKDQVVFVNYIFSKIDIENKKIAVFGFSEGGSVAPFLAATIPQITNLVVLGDGGMKGLDAYRIWGKKNGADFDEIYKAVSKEPVTNKFIGIYTYRYWKEILDVNPMDYLKEINIPIFYGIGKNDESWPVESVTYLKNRFKELGKTNLTTKFYADCSHDLEDSKGDSHMGEFLTNVYHWIHTENTDLTIFK